jgi:hypothetical protein
MDVQTGKNPPNELVTRPLEEYVSVVHLSLRPPCPLMDGY